MKNPAMMHFGLDKNHIQTTQSPAANAGSDQLLMPEYMINARSWTRS